MKYKKGTFVVIPNKNYLKGKPSEMQSIYFWLCEHADDNGGCFPTKDKIGEDAGCSHNTVDKYLKQLEDEGFLRITNRRKKGSKEFTSNHYQILIISQPPKVVSPSTNNGMTGSTNNGSETNLSINEPNLTTIQPLVEEEVFSFEEELDKLKGGVKKMKIIYLYWIKRKWKFENKKQFKSALGRELRPAQALEGYNSDQISEAMEFCEEKYSQWTLETLLKVLPSIINK